MLVHLGRETIYLNKYNIRYTTTNYVQTSHCLRPTVVSVTLIVIFGIKILKRVVRVYASMLPAMPWALMVENMFVNWHMNWIWFRYRHWKVLLYSHWIWLLNDIRYLRHNNIIVKKCDVYNDVSVNSYFIIPHKAEIGSYYEYLNSM